MQFIRSAVFAVVLVGCAPPPRETPDLASASADLAAPVETGDMAIAWDLYWVNSNEPPTENAGEPPPDWRCGTDADFPNGGPSCETPPSRCLDYRWLTYFVDGRCVTGKCQWQKKFLDCSANGEPKSCFNGGCEYNGTL